MKEMKQKRGKQKRQKREKSKKKSTKHTFPFVLIFGGNSVFMVGQQIRSLSFHC